MTKRTPNRGLILAASCITCGLTGSLYMWSIFTTPLIQEHGWSSTEVSLAYSLFLVMVCISGFFVGWLQRRFQPRYLVLIGGVAYSISWIFAGLVDSIPMLYLLFSIVGGAGNGFIYNTSVSVATKWFPDKKGFANGLCVGSAGLAPLVFAPLGGVLIERFNVSIAFIIAGIIPLVLYLVFSWVLRKPEDGWVPEGWTPEARGSEKALNNNFDFKASSMLKTPLFWCMWLLLAVAATSGSMMTGQAAAIGTQMIGLTTVQASLQVALLAVGNFCGRFGFGALSDRIGRLNTFVIMLAITTLDMLLFLPNVQDFVTFAAAIMIIGACFGGAMTVMPSLCGDLFGTINFSQNYSFLYSGYTLSGFIGPVLASTAFDSSGTYASAFVVAGVLAIVGIALTFVVRFLAKRFQSSHAVQQD